MSSERTGGCLCGAVRFRATDVPTKVGACHCPMCQRWTGSALIGVTVPLGSVVWEGELTEFASSSWAKRGFCAKCGSGLFFQVTLEGAYSDEIELPIGIFDDPGGFEMTNEIYIDHKPDSFAFAGEGRKTMTRAECVEKFAVLDSD